MVESTARRDNTDHDDTGEEVEQLRRDVAELQEALEEANAEVGRLHDKLKAIHAISGAAL